MDPSRYPTHAAWNNDPLDIDEGLFSPVDYSQGNYNSEDQHFSASTAQSTFQNNFFGLDDEVSAQLQQQQLNEERYDMQDTDHVQSSSTFHQVSYTNNSQVIAQHVQPPSVMFQTPVGDNASGGGKMNHKEGSLGRQDLLAKMYQNRSARNLSGSSQQAQQQHAGSKRVFREEPSEGDVKAGTASLKVPESTSSSTPGSPVLCMPVDSLLHNSCKLYPTTFEIVQSALQFDPDAIRRTVLVESNQKADASVEPLAKKQKLSDCFSYPVNIAIRHGGSAEVIEMLALAAPDVLVIRDGPCQGSSLAIAIRSDRNVAIIKTLLEINACQTQIADRLHDLPLHTALHVPTVSLAMVKFIHNAFPDALSKTNIRGKTPVHVAEGNPFCPEEVVNYLQEQAYSPFEAHALHIDDDVESRKLERKWEPDS